MLLVDGTIDAVADPSAAALGVAGLIPARNKNLYGLLVVPCVYVSLNVKPQY